VELHEPGLRLADMELLLYTPDAGYPAGRDIGRESLL
jgi:hypothetical protein